MSAVEFRREVRFIKGYDRTLEPGYGVHGMTIAMVLHGPLGAIEGDIGTGWVPTRSDGHKHSDRTPNMFPTGSGVFLHSPVQHKEWWSGPDECDIIGGPCYGDGGYLVSDTFVEHLVDEGEEAAWAYLEQLYESWFSEDEANS